MPDKKLKYKNKIKRVFLIVLDSAGIGAAPDAGDFGDAGTNTFGSISKSHLFDIPTLRRLGIGCIDGQKALGAVSAPEGAYCRLAERSRGKDTTTGHWEIAGLVSKTPFPTYPDGFPPEVISAFSSAVGRGVLCNRPYSGTAVIADYGREHIATGDLIVYTSADSVFQIAAHEDVVPPETLYEYCRTARRILTGRHAVGRVIARPFTGEYPDFVRTPRRHDFSLEPTGMTLLDAVSGAGLDCIGVGKIHDIFAGRGLTDFVYTSSNNDGTDKTDLIAARDFHGLCFVNLVDFDSSYGHRNNIDGYAGAMSEFDRWLSGFLTRMRGDDMLIITADHGCDPGNTATTDHTREYVPFIAAGRRVRSVNLGTACGFNNIAATVADLLGVGFDAGAPGFAARITRDTE